MHRLCLYGSAVDGNCMHSPIINRRPVGPYRIHVNRDHVDASFYFLDQDYNNSEYIRFWGFEEYLLAPIEL
jgi:hypothetical protein